MIMLISIALLQVAKGGLAPFLFLSDLLGKGDFAQTYICLQIAKFDLGDEALRQLLF